MNKSKIFICDSDRSKQKLYIEGFPNKITQIDSVLNKKKDFKILLEALPLVISKESGLTTPYVDFSNTTIVSLRE